MTGIVVSYLLSATGRDKAIIKGMGIGAILWIFINGLVIHLGLKIKSRKPMSPIFSFLDHIIFGSLAAFLVSKLGDDRLFPNKGKSSEKIPLVNTEEN